MWWWLLFACAGGPVADDAPVDTGEVVLPNLDPLTFCINEVMPENEGGKSTPGGLYEDWFELHNPTEVAVDLSGFGVSDEKSAPFKHSLAEGTLLEAGAFLLFWADDAPELGPDHVGFSLDKKGESIVLTSPDGRRLSLAFPEIVEDYSWARVSDCCVGEGCFGAVPLGTPGRSNLEAPSEGA